MAALEGRLAALEARLAQTDDALTQQYAALGRRVDDLAVVVRLTHVGALHHLTTQVEDLRARVERLAAAGTAGGGR